LARTGYLLRLRLGGKLRSLRNTEEEIRKFIRRFRQVGAHQWPADSRILDLFCGRGNGLKALERLGFEQLQGVDLSERLLAQYSDPLSCMWVTQVI